MLRNIFALVLASALIGCSTHPLPEDFSRATTFDIVRSIRCEVQRGLQNFTGEFPPAVPAGDGEVSAGGYPADFLRKTYVGFLFTFEIDEDNKATQASLKFANPFSDGSFKLDLSGGVSKHRETVRNLVVAETLEELKSGGPCEPAPRPNLLYPLAGRIGADEILTTYLRIERDMKFKGANGAQIFTDTLTFTTTLSAGVTPNLTLSAGSTEFKLKNASVKGSVERVDLHKVIIAIYYDKDLGVQRLARSDSPALLYEFPGPLFKAPDPLTRGAPSRARGQTGAGLGKNIVIQELYRLRALDEDQRLLEDIVVLP